MRIAFDHQAFCLQTTGGISRYFCRLAQELVHLEQKVGIFAPLYRNQYAKDLDIEIVHGISVNQYPAKTASAITLGNALLSKKQIKRWRPNLVHETYFSNTPSAPAKVPSVITVFDMIGELYGTDGTDLESRKTSKKYAAVARADRVICISEKTREDLINVFDAPAEKISVVYLGCDDVIKNLKLESTFQSDQNARPFLLYVGLRGHYKNFDRLLKALASSQRLKADFDLIAFGGGAFNSHEANQIEALQFKTKQIIQINGDDKVLDDLYRRAAALVYPSTYEGFGLPPLEAMARACPVVSSHASVMPEIIGQAAEFFEPSKPEAIAIAIEKVVYDNQRSQQLIGLGLSRFKLFTWQRCAQETLSVYRTLGLGSQAA
jgi:glycosyltransferase involved in cell wall biosynthesis